MAIVPTPLVGDNSAGLKQNKTKSKSGEGWHADMTEARKRKKGDKQLKAGHYWGTKGQRDRERETTEPSCLWVISATLFFLTPWSSHVFHIISFTDFRRPCFGTSAVLFFCFFALPPCLLSFVSQGFGCLSSKLRAPWNKLVSSHGYFDWR